MKLLKMENGHKRLKSIQQSRNRIEVVNERILVSVMVMAHMQNDLHP